MSEFMFSVGETDKLSSRMAVQVYGLEEKRSLGDPGGLSWDPEQPVCCLVPFPWGLFSPLFPEQTAKAWS